MIWTSKLEPVTVDDATVGDTIADAAETHAHRIALIDGPSGASVTYAELTSRIDRIAAWLSADGFGAGDRLAVWAPNVPRRRRVHAGGDLPRRRRHRDQPGMDR